MWSVDAEIAAEREQEVVLWKHNLANAHDKAWKQHLSNCKQARAIQLLAARLVIFETALLL